MIGTGRVSVMVKARPEKIDSMPSVTRKDGIFTLVTSTPDSDRAPIRNHTGAT